MKPWPLVSILCVNYNGSFLIENFLNSAKKLNYDQKNLQTIIIDNGSSDGSQKKIKKNKKVKLIALKKNYGFGPAINIGLKKAKGKYILITNNDLELGKNCLKTLVEYSQKNPQAAIIGGKILLQTNKKRIASANQTFSYLTGKVKMNTQSIRKPTNVEWVQGCAMFIPAEKLKKIGAFDPNFEKIYFEDLDLCKRAQILGFKTVIIPKAIFYHHQSYTVDNLVSKNFKWYNWHKNKIRFVIKHASILQIIPIINLEILSAIYSTLFKGEAQFIPALKALFENIRNFSQIRRERQRLYAQNAGFFK